MLNPRDRQHDRGVPRPIIADDDDSAGRLPRGLATWVIASLSLASWAVVIAVCEAFAAVLT